MKTNIAFWLLSAALVLSLPGCKKNPPAPQEVKVTSVTVTPSTLPLVEGESGDLTVTVLPSDATDPTVTWSSSDPSVASVSSGTVTAVSPGVATLFRSIKRGPGNRGPTECGTTHEATSGMSS